MIEIIPAIIPKSLEDLKSKLLVVQGKAPKVQIDVTDGVYAGAPSWPYHNNFLDFEKIEMGDEGLPMWEDFDFEFDLMIANAENDAESFLKAGASALIYHFESFDDMEILHGALATARDYDVEVGLALKPSTPNEKIYDFIAEIDFIQCMGSDKIGFQGEKLDERIYEKISDLRSEFPDMPIGVDIGVDFETSARLVEAGATRLVSGSAIFKSPDVEEAISKLKNG